MDLLRPTYHLLMRMAFQVTISGSLAPLDQQGIILAPKHSSRWDPLVIGLLTSRPLRFVTTHTEFKGFHGWLIRRLGAIPIVRERAGASTIKLLEEYLLADQPLVLFPEGGIREGYVGQLKPGLGRIVMALNSKFQKEIPVIPIQIHYEPAPQLGAQVHLQVLPALTPQPYLRPELGTDKQRAAALTDDLYNTLRAAMPSQPNPTDSLG